MTLSMSKFYELWVLQSIRIILHRVFYNDNVFSINKLKLHKGFFKDNIHIRVYF